MSQEITTREKALQAFEKALIKEKAGLMSEAVKYYRQAFKVRLIYNFIIYRPSPI